MDKQVSGGQQVLLNTALVFLNTKQVSVDANDICSAGKHCRCKEPLLDMP
jgi:hypothetical protein